MEEIKKEKLYNNLEKQILFTKSKINIKNIHVVHAKNINEVLEYMVNKKNKNYIIQENYLEDKIIGLKNTSTEQFLKGYEQALQIKIKILKD